MKWKIVFGEAAMQGTRRLFRISVLFMSLCVAGCAVTHEPEGWLANPGAMQTDTYGGWVQVKLNFASEEKAELGGELIAIGKDSMYIANETFHSIAIFSIKSAQLVAYEPHTEEMGGLFILGTLSSISNGVFLLITAPMWIMGGSLTTRARSYEPIVEYPKKELSRFAPFARFPQGLPAVVDRNQMHSRPAPAYDSR